MRQFRNKEIRPRPLTISIWTADRDLYNFPFHSIKRLTLNCCLWSLCEKLRYLGKESSPTVDPNRHWLYCHSSMFLWTSIVDGGRTHPSMIRLPLLYVFSCGPALLTLGGPIRQWSDCHSSMFFLWTNTVDVRRTQQSMIRLSLYVFLPN